MEGQGNPPAVTEYLAECLWPGVTAAELTDLDARARQTAEATAGSGDEVTYAGSILMPEDEVVFFVFTGPSADAVRNVAARVGIPFERIVGSVRVAATTETRER